MKISNHRSIFSFLSALVILITLLASAAPAFAANDGTAMYTVQSGERLADIAKHFGLTIEKILLANPEIKDANLIVSGQVIILPPGRSEGVTPDRLSRIYVWQRERDGGRVEKAEHLYLVKNGDNLTRIAKAYGVRLEKLLLANPQIDDANLLYRGELVKIPEGRGEFVPPFYMTPKPVAGENK